MLQVEITEPGGQRRELTAPDECVIGKGSESEIRLASWRIGREHARLFRTPGGVLIEDMGAFGGTMVNGQRIVQHGPLRASDDIVIGPFRLRVREIAEVRPALHPIEPLSARADRQDAPESPGRGQPSAAATPPADDAAGPRPSASPPLEFEWRRRLHGLLLDGIDLRRRDISRMSDAQLRREADTLLGEILAELAAELPAELDREQLRRQVLDEAVGLGPLEALLGDDGVTEIMVNRHDEIYVERGGRLLRHPLTFTDDRVVMGVIERIVAPIGRRIDEGSPMVDARLKDGSRVNAIIPPVALKGPTLTIRKFSKRRLTHEDLVAYRSVSPDMAQFLRICVEARKNVLISGGTGSGKTTLLNILSNFIPLRERILTIEDAAELRLHHEHLVSLEARPANAEGRGQVSIRELVRNALRMRPDRIVVGECRGAEALDMLQAMNTGHEGSLTTLHANSPRDALARLETMVLMAGMELPLAAIRDQITSAVDIIVQQTRFACGSRKITHIVEVTGMEAGKIQLQELFRFVSGGYGAEGVIEGRYAGCDLLPTFYDELLVTGLAPDPSLFRREEVQ